MDLTRITFVVIKITLPVYMRYTNHTEGVISVSLISIISPLISLLFLTFHFCYIGVNKDTAVSYLIKISNLYGQ